MRWHDVRVETIRAPVAEHLHHPVAHGGVYRPAIGVQESADATHSSLRLLLAGGAGSHEARWESVSGIQGTARRRQVSTMKNARAQVILLSASPFPPVIEQIVQRAAERD